MDIKTVICILAICIGTDGGMQPDEVNKLKEIIKNLTSVKLNFAEIRKEMDRFHECQCVNGRKNEPMPKISEIVKFQLESALYEFQFHLDDGVLNTNKGIKDTKQRIRNKIDRSMNYTKVSATKSSIKISLYMRIHTTKSYDTIYLCNKLYFRIECENIEPR